MHANYLLVNKSSNWEVVKTICEHFPQSNIVSPLALIIKTIYPVDGSTFMVTPKEEEVLWVPNLICKQQTYTFYALLTTINIVPKEQVICLWWVPTIFKKPKKISILTMNISCNIKSLISITKHQNWFLMCLSKYGQQK